jgi:hypothetical protein
MLSYRRYFLLCLVVLLSIYSARGETASTEIVAAAKAGLPVFLAAVPAGEKTGYGFDGRDDLAMATLGEPIPHYTVEPDALAAWQPATPVGALMKPTGLWYFPVLVRKEIKAFLIVARMDGKWKAVSLGMAPLAKSWAQVTKRWAVSAGYQPLLIEVYQANQFLFTVPEKGPDNLTPITPAPIGAVEQTAAGPADYTTLGDASTVLSDLRPRVQANLNGEYVP